MISHVDNETTLVRADIPKLGLTFLHSVETPKFVKSCFPKIKDKDIFTTPSQYLVVLNNCTIKNALEFSGGLGRRKQQISKQGHSTATLTFLYMKTADNLRIQYEQSSKIKCLS